MDRIDLLNLREDLESAMIDLAQQYGRCEDEGLRGIIRDGYIAYQRKLDNVNAKLGQ